MGGIYMQYAIELYFDIETERKIMRLSNMIASNGISTRFVEWKTRPHVTLACYNDVDEDSCKKLLSEFVEGEKAFPAYLTSVGMFTDTKTIFISPLMNSNLHGLQRRLYELLHDFNNKGWKWYSPDGWVPHCTLALNREDEEDAFYKASELVLRNFHKMEGVFCKIGLVKVTYPVHEVFTLNLL